MKVSELKNILFSNRDNVQLVNVYSQSENEYVESNCSADYVVDAYANETLLRIEAENNTVILTIE